MEKKKREIKSNPENGRKEANRKIQKKKQQKQSAVTSVSVMAVNELFKKMVVVLNAVRIRSLSLFKSTLTTCSHTSMHAIILIN